MESKTREEGIYSAVLGRWIGLAVSNIQQEVTRMVRTSMVPTVSDLRDVIFAVCLRV